MKTVSELLKTYMETHPFDTGDPDCQSVLDLLYRAYSENHENDPPEIREGFQELDTYLEKISLIENNTVFSLCCRLCVAYERKSFQDGVRYGAALMMELKNENSPN